MTDADRIAELLEWFDTDPPVYVGMQEEGQCRAYSADIERLCEGFRLLRDRVLKFEVENASLKNGYAEVVTSEAVLRTRDAELEAALEPFACQAKKFDWRLGRQHEFEGVRFSDDDAKVFVEATVVVPAKDGDLRVGDFRAASAALDKTRETSLPPQPKGE